jgi:hypothetical protein
VNNRPHWRISVWTRGSLYVPTRGLEAGWEVGVLVRAGSGPRRMVCWEDKKSGLLIHVNQSKDPDPRRARQRWLVKILWLAK